MDIEHTNMYIHLHEFVELNLLNLNKYMYSLINY